VTVTAGSDAAPYYTRRFVRGETDEIRLYLQGGNDHVERHGSGGGIHVRIIGGGGGKTIESPDTRSEIWADGGQFTGQKVGHARSWKNPEAVKEAPWLEPRNFGTWSLWTPMASYSSDLGAVIGASLVHTTYGFRSVPAAKEQTIRGAWSFGQSSGKVEYDGTFRRSASPVGFDLRAFASGIEQVRFYGLGDDTPRQSRTRARIQQTVFTFAPAVRIGQSARASLTIGPEFRYSDTGKRTGTVLFEQSPYGVGQFSLADVRLGLQLDSRRNTNRGLLEVALADSTGDVADQSSGNGVRLSASTFGAPAVLDVTKAYGGVDGYVAGYVGNSTVQLATRVGGERLFGPYPWFDAAFLGGMNDRGFHSRRYAGDASVYGNLELRTYLGPPVFASIFPVRFGIIGFADTGRVWVKSESSNTWHPSYGGGLLLKPVGTGIILRAVVATSPEGQLLYAGTGLRF
jgi:hypothetical protein